MPFTSKLLKENTWAIFGHGSTAYLAVGDNEGAMIDTGDDPDNIRAYAEALCGKPVRTALNTHGHFDHTGGNGNFERAYMGRLAAVIAREPNGGQDILKYSVDYEIITVGDGFTIDLGNRELEAFLMDGHSPDSIAWLDKRARILYTGDNMGPFVPMQYKCVDPQPSMLLFSMSVAKLYARRDEYDHTCAGHGDGLLDADMVNHTLIAALRALDGETDEAPPRPKNERSEGDKGPDFSKHHPASCVRWKDASIMFDARYLRDTERRDIIRGT